MARHKKIYRDKQHEQMKKRNKIRTVVSSSLGVFWIVAICICGALQHNDTVVGLGMITIGIANTAYCIFSFRVRHLGWKCMTIYDSDELYCDKYRFSEDAEKNSQEIEIHGLIVDIIIVLFTVFCFAGGIIKLM